MVHHRFKPIVYEISGAFGPTNVARFVGLGLQGDEAAMTFAPSQ